MLLMLLVRNFVLNLHKIIKGITSCLKRTCHHQGFSHNNAVSFEFVLNLSSNLLNDKPVSKASNLYFCLRSLSEVSEQNTGTRLLPFSINGTTFYAVPLSILGRTPSS